MTGFDGVFFVVSVIAGAVAAVSGFGIGSILTPLLALQSGTKTAVAVIAIPHFIGTLIRFWLIRNYVNRTVLIEFGIASAAGGVVGAFLHSSLQSAALTFVFGGVLIFAGLMGMTDLAHKVRFHGFLAWGAGALSGGFGGLVGSQGGIRSAALMAFDLPKESLIATATAIGVVVDLARMPVYLFTEHQQIFSAWPRVVAGTVGVVAGTWVGIRFLGRISESRFRKVLSVLILVLGTYMILRRAGMFGAGAVE